MIWLSALGPARIAGAFVTLALFIALCAATTWRERQRRRAEHQRAQGLLPANDTTAPLLVAHASQTGTAGELAWQSAQALQRAGVPARVLPLSAVTLDLLRRAQRALFIVSTYGEGDPPDAAAPFVRATMLGGTQARDLGNLHFAVLALGDSAYTHYCGFGRTLDQWLHERGATPLFERIDADKVADAAIGCWRGQLAQVAGISDAPDWSGPAFTRWTLCTRERLNPGSDGETVCHLELRPADGAPLPDWEAGDLRPATCCRCACPASRCRASIRSPRSRATAACSCWYGRRGGRTAVRASPRAGCCRSRALAGNWRHGFAPTADSAWKTTPDGR